MSALLRQLWVRVCGRLDFQERVVGPVIVNLTTGLIVFLVLAVAKDWIYPLILPKPSDVSFPIHASAEAFQSPSGSGQLEGEIYLANLRSESLDDAALRKWLSDRMNDRFPRDPDARIFVSWSMPDGRMTLTNDDEFNAGKGRLEVSPLSDDGRRWSIRIWDINATALLRVRVLTDSEQIITRADVGSLPFSIETPRAH